MPMTERVARLRQASLDAVETLSTERAELLTAFYREHTKLVSPPVQRALAFRYLLAHKTIYIGEGELIVGEKGATPKATPTYPELCCHSTADLEILDVSSTSPEFSSFFSSRFTIPPFGSLRLPVVDCGVLQRPAAQKSSQQHTPQIIGPDGGTRCD